MQCCLLVLVWFMLTLTYYQQSKSCKHELIWNGMVHSLDSFGDCHKHGPMRETKAQFIPVADSRSCCTSLQLLCLFIFSDVKELTKKDAVETEIGPHGFKCRSLCGP